MNLAEEVAALQWFHTIDFGDAIVSPGAASPEVLRAQAEIYFAGTVAHNSSVLDIGCWDGFNALEAHKRGASRVVATDHFAWHRGWGNRQCIELVREHLAPKIEIIDIDIPDLSPERIGRFDVVLFCGILYHLQDPLAGLRIAAALAEEMLVVETHMDAAEIERPAAIFYPGDELNGDSSNWWGPNRACVEGMLHAVGFPGIEFTEHPIIPSRGIFRARR